MKPLACFLVACVLLAGCSTGATSPAPAASQPAATEQPAVPPASEVCLKPEDKSGVHIDLYQPLGGDSAFRALPGWTIARVAQDLQGAVFFPEGTDLKNVKITAEPSGVWKAQPAGINVNNAVAFRFTAGSADATRFAAPGWITLAIDGAKDAGGKPLSEKPLTLKIYGFTPEQEKDHSYLSACWSSLVVPHVGDH